MLVQLKVVQSSSLRKRFGVRMLVQLKVVQSSSLRKRVRYADVGSAKSSSVKQSQEKGMVCGCWFSLK